MTEVDAARYVAALREQRNAALDAAAEWRSHAEVRAAEVADLRKQLADLAAPAVNVTSTPIAPRTRPHAVPPPESTEAG